ncbi:MAG: hypothetical protein ACI9XC_000675 [Gammaproteobacteria bacterium]|jgi:hypothetical protein
MSLCNIMIIINEFNEFNNFLMNLEDFYRRSPKLVLITIYLYNKLFIKLLTNCFIRLNTYDINRSDSDIAYLSVIPAT